ncbi:hypothetical protein KEG38_36720 [Polyangium jinanense]|uniref:hypothetical protein n=1 Tax=Polyangium jinanense TaxID=2829994 RepID=UPI00233FC524|nr:hypothetical protein [Polyangium jinanense]MDC3959456.1 hypothetical protein [Polyangium jinanense]
MADRYIDDGEVSEYGRHFVTEAKKLVGASELVDVAKLIARVLGAVEAVETELAKVRSQRSEVRTERGGTGEAEEAVRDVVTRFHAYLRSLPKGTSFDFEAFYPGKNLGEVAALKPADLVTKAADVLRGFDVARNAGLDAFVPWKQEIAGARSALDAALSGKSGAANRSVTTTAGLAAARAHFLKTYNQVAKPIVRGVLNELGRGEEVRLFFKDLTVQEGRGRGGNGEEEQP